MNVMLSYDYSDVLNLGNELLLTGDFKSFAFNFYPDLIARYYRTIQTYQAGNFRIDENQTIYQNLIYVFENSKTMKDNQKLINFQ
jgi:hypothetical protein